MRFNSFNDKICTSEGLNPFEHQIDEKSFHNMRHSSYYYFQGLKIYIILNSRFSKDLRLQETHGNAVWDHSLLFRLILRALRRSLREEQSCGSF